MKCKKCGAELAEIKPEVVQMVFAIYCRVCKTDVRGQYLAKLMKEA